MATAPDYACLPRAYINSSRKASNGPFLSFRPPPKACARHRQLLLRRVQVYALASASSGDKNNRLEDLAARLVEAAHSLSQKTGHAFESAWLQTVKFVESQNLQGKIEQSFPAANRKLEELSYDACKGVQKFDSQFRISERVQEIASKNLPQYRRQLDKFLQTPIGRLFATIFFMWFLLSGWFFRVILFSMWVLPLAAPLLIISSAARRMIVELHPRWQQKALRETCEKVNVHVSAWSPLGAPLTQWGSPEILNDALIKDMALKKWEDSSTGCFEVGIGQRSRGTLPKSFSKKRMAQNIDIFGWHLTNEDHEIVSKIEQKKNVDGSFICNAVSGPYKNVQELWDGEM